MKENLGYYREEETRPEYNFYGFMKNSHAIEIRSNDIEEAVDLVQQFVSARLCLTSGDICKTSLEIPYAEFLRIAAKNCETVVLIVGTDTKKSFKDWLSFIRYCSKQIPETTAVLALYNYDNFSERRLVYSLQGFEFNFNKMETRLINVINLNQVHVLKEESIGLISQNHANFSSNNEIVQKQQNEEDGEVFMYRERQSETCSSEDDLFSMSSSSKHGNSSSSSSFSTMDFPSLLSGWPLVKVSSSSSLKEEEEVERSSSCSQKLPENLKLVLKNNSSNCRIFSYSELITASSNFSSDNLIGEGGCSSVYKGTLPDERTVAIKVLKPYKDAWNDFILEIEIVSSLKNKHITSLIGVCLEEDQIISVYGFLPKGSLEDHVHGNGRKGIFPWKARFKAAIAVAEALNYLHNECSLPVIHRDVKSSNILLSHKFQAQLSDFGLAIRGPKDSQFLSHTDVVGTFGYIAPEYFMHGRVSDKVDVYSFGVVLLELLSGRRPVGTNTLKGRENMVKWAKSLIEAGMLKALMDPKLNGKFDIVQMHRMVLAATLCITPSPRLRPNMSQILQLLKGDTKTEEWTKSYIDNIKVAANKEEDEIYSSKFSSSRRLDFALLELDDDTTTNAATTTMIKSNQQRKPIRLKDYLRESQD